MFPGFVLGAVDRERYSIRQYHEDLQAAGVDIGRSTLRTYAQRYGWLGRREELLERMRRERGPGIERIAQAIQERHGRVARAVLGAGSAALQALLNDPDRLSRLGVQEIARLLQLGLTAENRSAGAALTRQEILVETWNGVTSAVMRIFTAANALADPDERAERFAGALDDYVSARLLELAERGDEVAP